MAKVKKKTAKKTAKKKALQKLPRGVVATMNTAVGKLNKVAEFINQK